MRRSRGWRPCPRWWTPASRTSITSSPIRSSSSAAGTRPEAGSGTSATSHGRTSRTTPPRERMRAAGDRAATHLERFVERLDELVETAHGSWQLGEERYSRVLREREVLPDDARQLRERGQREFDRLDAEMRALAADATGNPDYVAVLRENDAQHPPTEQAMLDAYTEWTERARQFLLDTGLVTFPAGETCAVVPSPVFQRPVVGVASYIAPPASATRDAATSSSRSRPTARARRRSRSACRTTATGRSRRPPSTRRTPATTGTSSSASRRPRHGCARSTGRPTSMRAGRCTRSASCANGASSRTRSTSCSTWTPRSSAPRGSSSTRRSIWGDGRRRGGHVHARQGRPARGRRGRGGRPVLLVAHPGVVLPDRLPRDPRDPAALPRCPRVRGRGPRRRPCRGAARLPRHDRRGRFCRWAWPIARSWRRSPDRETACR